jgi:hypothetical protein
MAIMVRHPLHLLRLRFPVGFRIKVWAGAVTVHNQGAIKKLHCGESVVVPAFLRFDCDVMPLRNRAAMFSLAREPATADADACVAADPSNAWSRALAYDVFMSPQTGWNAVNLASRWQVTLHQARARLFAEGEALHSLVREQRLAYALHIIGRMEGAGAGDMASIAMESGFTSTATFADACSEVTGVRAEILLRNRLFAVC